MVTCPVTCQMPRTSISPENNVIRSTNAPKPELLGTAALLGCVVCWASVPVMLRGLTPSFDPWTVNGFRYPLAAVLYWPVLLAAYRHGLIDRTVWGRCMVPAGFALIAQVLWGLAPYFLAASSMGFFARLSAVWTVAAAMVFYRDERVLLGSLGFYLGAILTFLGFLILALSRGQVGGQVTWAGITIMLFWSFFFGMYGASVRHYLRGIHPLIGFAIVSQMVGTGTFSAMWVFGQPQQLLHPTWQTGSLLVFSSVLGIAMGHFFLFTAVQRLGAALPACVGAVAPFLTVALASAFLGETLTGIQWVAGITMVLGAIVLLSNRQMVVRSLRANSATNS
jgi:drug/metabolite transporter (DMT)-like permease